MDIVNRRASDSFVGREHELAALVGALDSGVLVVHLHGIGGIGKTTLLAAFAERARARGAAVIRLDCRSIEPTERGFLGELATVIGGRIGTLAQAAERLGALAGRVVLVLDGYESFRLLDAWLRQQFVVELPENVGVVLSGRDRPVTAWLAMPGAVELVRVLGLGPLAESEAVELLERNGVAADLARRINRFAGGHPLALRLAAAAAPGWYVPETAAAPPEAHTVVEELTRTYLADVTDPLTRRALDAASVLRRTTLSLVHALLPDVAAQDAFERLRALPFVESEQDGLQLHDLVRQAVALSLRAADPSRYDEYRKAAWRLLKAESRRAGRAQLWRYTADLLFLIENPVVREAFFPTGGQSLVVEPARAGDEREILDVAALHDGPRGAALLESLWRHLPNAFRVVRGRAGSVLGFYAIFEPSDLGSDATAKDPLASRWAEHLRAAPVPKGQRVLFVRRWLSGEHGEAPSPVQAACWLDAKRAYMELRPELRRVYIAVRDFDTYVPAAVRLGFQPLASANAEIDGSVYQTAMLDLGPASVDGWLAGLVAAELGVEEERMLDAQSRELVLDGARVRLTRLEFGVFEYLYRNEGKAVTRVDLIENVWGFSYSGSNVVEAVVRSLRRKLGDWASAVETVRGVGYRFRRV
jgi:hypothetical protein